jgi:hypothetical protein
MEMARRQTEIRQLNSISSAQWVTQWEVPSLTSSHVYKVSQKIDASFACDCPAWKFKKAGPEGRPDCKHILRIKSQEPVDTSRVPQPVRVPGRATATFKLPKRSTKEVFGVEDPGEDASTGVPAFLLQTRRRIQLED